MDRMNTKRELHLTASILTRAYRDDPGSWPEARDTSSCVACVGPDKHNRSRGILEDRVDGQVSESGLWYFVFEIDGSEQLLRTDWQPVRFRRRGDLSEHGHRFNR